MIPITYLSVASTFFRSQCITPSDQVLRAGVERPRSGFKTLICKRPFTEERLFGFESTSNPFIPENETAS
jgi:hypothetical protein